jgi:tetratricopeptide (TPR) repeat protein
MSLDRFAPRVWLVTVVLAFAVGAVYGPFLNVPFIFDDTYGILGNESIISLWPLVGTTDHPGPLRPGQQLTTAARPLVNLSFAINYKLGEFTPAGYHAANVLIHFLSSLLLFLVIRRTLCLPYFTGRYETSAGWLAFAGALIWALHPLQTEAVIYATQRTELMFAFFYLAAFYCSLRYWAASGDPTQRVLWLSLAVLASLAGMASKEVMVSAPLLVLLFERTFIAGSLAKALRQSWPLYAGLAATWLLLVGLLLGAPHSESAGFGIGVTGGEWWLTQTKALWIYFKLVVWPWPLLIHYQFPYLHTFAESWMYLPTLLIVIATLILLWRNHPVGYLGTWMFAILSPTLIIPIPTEIAAERRMYLPLAALATLFVVGGRMLIEFMLRRWARDRQLAASESWSLVAIVATSLFLVGVFATIIAKRLPTFRDEKTLWREVLRIYPDDEVALYNLGCGLMASGQLPEALDALQAARAQKPDDVDVLNNLGVALMQSRQYQEGYQHLQHAAQLQPKAFDVHANLGLLLTHAGNHAEAIDQLQAALALKPNDVSTLTALGRALVLAQRHSEAIEVLDRAVHLQPDRIDSHKHLGAAYGQSGKDSLAIEQYRKTIELDPADTDAHFVLAQLLSKSGQNKEAIFQYNEALRLSPESPEIHNCLADLLLQLDRAGEAIQQYQLAIRYKSDYLPSYVNLAKALAISNKSTEAMAAAEKGIETARSVKDQSGAEQLEEWLKHYHAELRRHENGARDSSSPK